MSCLQNAVYSTVIHCTGTQIITKDAFTLASGEAFDICIMVVTCTNALIQFIQTSTLITPLTLNGFHS